MDNKQQDISELYIIRYNGRYMAKGQKVKFTSILGDAELFNDRGCAESFRDILGKNIEFEVVNVKDLGRSDGKYKN